MVAGGAALGALPFLVWYSAESPGGRSTATGVGATGELWSLPVLAALIVAAGALALVLGGSAGSRRGRRLGAVALAAGAVSAFWAIKNGVDVPVRLVSTPGGRPVRPPGAVEVEPAAFGAAAAAACVALAGILALFPEAAR
jgi:hypothetical protein